MPHIQRAELSDAPVPPAETAEVYVLPASVGQQGFWFLDRLDPGNPAYNIAVRFRIEGPLSVPLLERAFNEMIVRHESLRTGFEEVDGETVQTVAPAASIRVPVIDLRAIPAAGRTATADQHAIEEAAKPFDLSVPPLIRASLLRLDEQDHMLLVTVHHIVSDGWSIGLISDELGSLYEAFSQGLGDPLPPLAIQYGDFAAWQKEWLETAGLERQLAYWKKQLANVAQLDIPTDRPRPPVQTHNGYIESILLSRELTGALRDYSTREGVTMFMTSLAALQILLHRYSGQTDICVGSLVVGRNRVETEPLIGLFVNPLVLRTDLSGEPKFPELMARVRETVLGALANQDLPFQRLVMEVRPKRDSSRHPVFQTNFVYQRDFVKPLHFAGLTLTAVPSKSPGSIYDLNFFMVERADGWRASCEYNTDLYDATTIQRMLQQFQAILEGIAADASRPIASFPLLTGEELRRVVILPPLEGPDNRAPGAPAHSVAAVAPRDDVERRLVKIWARLLGVEVPSVTADFFELGGHSLMAARLLTQVERAFDKRLSLIELLEAPTIENLASRVRNAGSSTQPPLLNISNPNGSKPIFAVLGGAEYRSLARRLGPDQPVLGLPDSGLPDLQAPFRIEDFAACFVDTLLRVQPRGPYFLGGYCRAGIVAYEMAQQLRSRGHEVALLALFDSWNIEYIKKFQGVKAAAPRIYLMFQKLKYHLGEARRRGFRDTFAYAGEIGKAIGVRCQDACRRIWYRLVLHTNSPIHETLREAGPHMAVDSYVPQPYPGKIVLFRVPNLQSGRYYDPSLGWGELARGGLTAYEVPGTHQDMLREPIVEIVAAHLSANLDQAREAVK